MKGKNTKRKKFYSYQKIPFSSEELKPSTTSKRFKKKSLQGYVHYSILCPNVYYVC